MLIKVLYLTSSLSKAFLVPESSSTGPEAKETKNLKVTLPKMSIRRLRAISPQRIPRNVRW